MKIALLLTGLPRSFKTCFKNFQKYVIQANPDHQFDIFISTWEADRASLVKAQPENEGSTQELLDLYQPKAYSIEKYDEDKKKELAREVRLEEFWQFVRESKVEKRTDGRWGIHQNLCEVCGHYGA